MSQLTFVIRNISWACSKHDLRTYFKKFGSVQNIYIPMNNETGFNKKMAFVRMIGDAGFANSVLKDVHFIDGSEVTVELGNKRVKK